MLPLRTAHPSRGLNTWKSMTNAYNGSYHHLLPRLIFNESFCCRLHTVRYYLLKSLRSGSPLEPFCRLLSGWQRWCWPANAAGLQAGIRRCDAAAAATINQLPDLFCLRCNRPRVGRVTILRPAPGTRRPPSDYTLPWDPETTIYAGVTSGYSHQ